MHYPLLLSRPPLPRVNHTLPLADDDRKYTDIEDAAEVVAEDRTLVEMRELVADVKCQNIILCILLATWLLFLMLVGHINYEIYENSKEVVAYCGARCGGHHNSHHG
jgi:hypothetical protein